ncbi:MAG: regulatory protein RecX [Candidatus Marinimicrobia bacterium]|nr:regulatory protein RecX [Candidatus Neomarinimicrobiota bacterium]
MKINNIQRQKRRARYTITLSNGDVFGISEGVFISSGLAIGDTVEKDRLLSIIQKENISKIKDSAYLLLSYRSRSKHELKTRLLEKEYTLNDILPVLKELEQLGLINDQSFIESYIRDQVHLKKLGPFALKASIIKFKIEDVLVEYAIDKIYKKYPVPDLIQELLLKKMKILAKPIDDNSKTKLINFLKRKGFSWADIEPKLIENGIL